MHILFYISAIFGRIVVKCGVLEPLALFIRVIGKELRRYSLGVAACTSFLSTLPLVARLKVVLLAWMILFSDS